MLILLAVFIHADLAKDHTKGIAWVPRSRFTWELQRPEPYRRATSWAIWISVVRVWVEALPD
jgi:hypothetical protein